MTFLLLLRLSLFHLCQDKMSIHLVGKVAARLLSGATQLDYGVTGPECATVVGNDLPGQIQSISPCV